MRAPQERLHQETPWVNKALPEYTAMELPQFHTNRLHTFEPHYSHFTLLNSSPGNPNHSSSLRLCDFYRRGPGHSPHCTPSVIEQTADLGCSKISVPERKFKHHEAVTVHTRLPDGKPLTAARSFTDPLLAHRNLLHRIGFSSWVSQYR